MRATRLPTVALALCLGVLAIHLVPGGGIVPGAVAVVAFACRRRSIAVALAVGAIAAGFQLDELADARARGTAAGAGDRRDDVVIGEVIGVERARDWVRALIRADPPLDADVMVTVQGAAAAPLPGDRARVRGRLFLPRGYRVDGAPDPVRALASRGAALSMSVQPAAASWTPGGGRPLSRAAERAHRQISAWLETRGGGWSGNAVMRAMLTGDRRDLDGPINDAFQDAGLGHVLSVSGLHLAVIAMFAYGLWRRLWLLVPPLADRLDAGRAAALAAIPIAAAYTLITGLRAPTLRAGIAVVVVLVGVLLRRRARAIDAISLAACAIVADNPCALFDPSFQLSFAAAATLALVAGRVRRGRLRWLRGVFSATLWATAATAPIAALHFSTVSIASVATNLVVIPAVEMVGLPLGFLGVAIAGVWENAGGALVDLSIAIAAWITWFAAKAAAVAPATAIAGPDPVELCALALAWTGAVAWARWRTQLPVVIAAAAVAFACGWRLWMTEAAPRLRDDLQVTFVDVGQGDAAVVELPGGEVWLIDAGGLPFPPPGASPEDAARAVAAPGERALLPFLRHRRIDRVDVAVLSHAHPDHYAGMAALVGNIDIDELWLASGSPDAAWPPAFSALVDRLRAAGTRIVHPPLGRIRRAGVDIEILAPRIDPARATADPVMTENDNSLVLRIERAGASILFAGDSEEEGEQELLAGVPGIAADVVKVPHHGSSTSSTPAFVRATAPRLAIVSCGLANRFDFPAPDVVARWKAAGARVWRTDLDGSVTVVIARDGRLSLEPHSR